MKQCSGCKNTLANTEFYTVRQRGKERLNAKCKACKAEDDRSPACRYSRARATARIYQVAFDITLAEYTELVVKPCHYCKRPAEVSSGVGLDRLDPLIGYTYANCVPCCWRDNYVKRSMFIPSEMEILGPLLNQFAEERAKSGGPPLEPPLKGTRPKEKPYPLAPQGWQYGHKRHKRD